MEGGQNSPGAHFVGAFKHRCVFKLGAKEETGKCGKKHIPLLSVGRMTVAISPSLPNGEGSSAASCAVGRPCRVAAGARRPPGIRLPGGGCAGGGSGHDGPPAGSFLSLSCLPLPPDRPHVCVRVQVRFQAENPESGVGVLCWRRSGGDLGRSSVVSLSLRGERKRGARPAGGTMSDLGGSRGSAPAP